MREDAGLKECWLVYSFLGARLWKAGSKFAGPLEAGQFPRKLGAV